MKSLIAALRSLTLPWGRTSGQRIVLDGDAGTIQIYDTAGALVALITPDDGTGNAGFFTYDSRQGIVYESALTTGNLSLGVAGQDTKGGAAYSDLGSGLYELFLSSGHGPDTASAVVNLYSETAAAAGDRRVNVQADDLELIGGSFTAPNIRSGQAQTPGSGVAGGGTTTVAVDFGAFGTMPATPRVVLTPETTTDPETRIIRAYVDSVTTSGFTIRCYRNSDSVTNINWLALSA